MNHRLPNMEALALEFTPFDAVQSDWAVSTSQADSWESQFHARIMEIAEVPESCLKHQASLREDLGLDSLDMVELVMLCEKDFRIDLQDHEWVRLRTIGELHTLFAEKITERA